MLEVSKAYLVGQPRAWMPPGRTGGTQTRSRSLHLSFRRSTSLPIPARSLLPAPSSRDGEQARVQSRAGLISAFPWTTGGHGKPVLLRRVIDTLGISSVLSHFPNQLSSGKEAVAVTV